MELPGEISGAFNQTIENAQLEQLPDDCQAFGDGGAHDMIRKSEETQSVNPASKSGKILRPKPNVVPPPLDVANSFATMFDSTERRFSLGEDGTCVVEVASGVTTESTQIIASVFSDAGCTTRLGSISTAEPLSRAVGLKATCSCERHKRERLKPCICWIRFNKTMDNSNEARWAMFKSLALWLAKGATCTREEHLEASFNLKVKSGMRPRNRDD